MIEVASNRLAIDADTVRAIEALDLFARELRDAGITPVVVESGRGRHLFASVRPFERPMWRWRATQRGLDARDTIRPPLTPHPSGLPVRIVGMPIVEALGALDGPPTGGRTLAPHHEALLEGRGVHRGTRSEKVQSLATAAYAADWTRHEFVTRVRSSPTWRAFLADHGPDALDRAWTKARQRVDAQRAADRNQVISIMIAVDIMAWTGAAGRTDHQVLAAHLNVAYRRGSVGHVLTIADAAIAAGVSRRTVQNSRSRLESLGVLERVSEGGGSNAAEWKVRRPCVDAQSCHPVLTPPGNQENRWASPRAWWDDPGSDAYRWSALGKCAIEVFAVLDTVDEPLTAARIAAACPSQPHAATVRRVLLKAQGSNLVEGAPYDGWRLVPAPSGLTGAAEAAGTSGRRDAAIAARDLDRARRSRERFEFATGAGRNRLEEIAPYRPVPGEPTKMLDPATGEVLDRPTQVVVDHEPEALPVETHVPAGLLEHLGYLREERSA